MHFLVSNFVANSKCINRNLYTKTYGKQSVSYVTTSVQLNCTFCDFTNPVGEEDFSQSVMIHPPKQHNHTGD